jgi:hypothetical protein
MNIREKSEIAVGDSARSLWPSPSRSCGHGSCPKLYGLHCCLVIRRWWLFVLAPGKAASVLGHSICVGVGYAFAVAVGVCKLNVSTSCTPYACWVPHGCQLPIPLFPVVAAYLGVSAGFASRGVFDVVSISSILASVQMIVLLPLCTWRGGAVFAGVYFWSQGSRGSGALRVHFW